MIRKPLQTLHSETITGTASGSSAFSLGYFDFDNLVGKLTVEAGFSGTLNVVVQTTDDGGTTYYDIGSFSQVVGAISNASAQWMVMPLTGGGGGSFVAGTTTQSTAAGAKLGGAVTGLPILSANFRTLYNYVTGSTSARFTIAYLANTQSGVGY